MYSLNEVRKRSVRHNSQKNNRLMFFASKISIYFSWIFVNVGLSPNQVTLVFFVTGLLGSIILLKNTLFSVLFAYLLYRLHIVFDVSDGEVARFQQKFSINGIYWDYMVHAVLYPLYFINMCVAQYLYYKNVYFLMFASIGSVIVSLMLAVKNNYYRAMFFDGQSIDIHKKKSTTVNQKYYAFYNAVSLALGFEGFFFFYIVLFFINNELLYIALFGLYIFLFSIIGLVKFIGFSKKGFYTTRS